jgi:hypothetical protein
MEVHRREKGGEPEEGQSKKVWPYHSLLATRDGNCGL